MPSSMNLLSSKSELDILKTKSNESTLSNFLIKMSSKLRIGNSNVNQWTVNHGPTSEALSFGCYFGMELWLRGDVNV